MDCQAQDVVIPKHTTERLCVKDTPERQINKLRDEYLRSMNQGLQGVGGATNFQYYVEKTYLTAHFTNTPSVRT
jgi:hypothetical protein